LKREFQALNSAHSCKRCIYYGKTACAVNPEKFAELSELNQLVNKNECEHFVPEIDRKVLSKRRFDWVDRQFWVRAVQILPHLIILVLVLAGFMSLYPDLKIKLFVLMMFVIIMSLGFFVGKFIR
jgi:hypothetical protein